MVVSMRSALSMFAAFALSGVLGPTAVAFNILGIPGQDKLRYAASRSWRRVPAVPSTGGGESARRRTVLGSSQIAESTTSRHGVRILEGGEPALVVNEDGDKRWNKCNEFVELGSSGLKVSRIGFGCIMVGGQMNEEQSHEVLNHAFDKAGINWLDTSETFPHPIYPDHKFKADPILGSWLKGRDRSKVILSTKVAGHSEQCTWLRKDGGRTCLNRSQILESVESSLERLGTDYIDILHIGDWPERKIVDYGRYFYDYSEEYPVASDIEEQLMAVQELVNQGVVRHVAVANETPYGVTKFVEHAIWDDLPRIVCVQSPYNLLTQNRVELALVEACAPRQCNVGIVAITPLAGGGLTGKYMYEREAYKNRKFRFNKYPGFQARFNSRRIYDILERYKAIAARYDLTLQQLALAFVHTRPFISASLVGATSVEQLDQNIGTLGIDLPQECVDEIYRLQDEHIEPTIGGSEFSLWHDYHDDLPARVKDIMEGDG